MMKITSRNMKKKTRGQSAIEYALVLGVIVVGVIFAGRTVFMGADGKGGQAQKIMEKAVGQTMKTLSNE
ncbi:MAG: class III signal peptide-containing protein [Bdellovibrionales bacterium]|nr:class III signal peptide-containing protein [Bdellovibrionales bacterium]